MKNWYSLFKTGTYLFAVLGGLLIPFPFYLVDFQERIAPVLLGAPVSGLTLLLFHASPGNADFSSDTPALCALMILLAVLALLLAGIIRAIEVFRRQQAAIIAACRIVCCYYLSLQLLKYGFDKLFKAQFYLPEPNTLYTPFGQLGKDILFWTTMGTSWSFNVFMGMMELIPAIMLLFKRTRVLGLVLATSVLLPVVMINFSFGISVKLYASFLLFLSVLLLSPFITPLYGFLLQQKRVVLPADIWTIPFPLPIYLKTALKTFIIGLLFLEALYPFLQSGNFNDDLAPRPSIHGAYEVMSMVAANGDTLQRPYPIKRFFIHRRDYFILQDDQDNMQDFKLSVDTMKGIFILTDYDLAKTVLLFHLEAKDSILELQYPYHSQYYRLKGKSLPWKTLPALNPPN